MFITALRHCFPTNMFSRSLMIHREFSIFPFQWYRNCEKKTTRNSTRICCYRLEKCQRTILYQTTAKKATKNKQKIIIKIKTHALFTVQTYCWFYCWHFTSRSHMHGKTKRATKTNNELCVAMAIHCQYALSYCTSKCPSSSQLIKAVKFSGGFNRFHNSPQQKKKL